MSPHRDLRPQAEFSEATGSREKETAEKRGGLAPAQLKMLVPVSRRTQRFSARFLTPLQAQRSPFNTDQPWDRGAQPPAGRSSDPGVIPEPPQRPPGLSAG